jgi:hypothetical protein
MNKVPKKRQQFLINPAFQVSVIRQMLVLTGLVIGIFYAANYYHFWSLAAQGLALGLPPTHVFFKFLSEQQRTMDLIFIVTSLLTLVTIVGFGLFLSHRVAGPLYRLKQYLAEPSADTQTLEPLKFRDGDYFPDVAEAINVRLSQPSKSSSSKT